MTDTSRIGPPSWIKEMNEGLMAQERQGSLGFPLSVLTVPGRRSGRPRSTPLTVLEKDGQRYVVGGFPAADWIRNVRAAGGGTLAVAGVEEPVRLVELDVDEARPIMREWPVVAPRGVEMMRDAGVVADTTPDELEKAAGICPVFRIESDA